MLEPRGRTYLRQESLTAECGTEIGMQNLHGDIAVVPDVVRQVDSRHAALPDLVIDAVAVGQSFSKSGGHSRQSVLHCIGMCIASRNANIRQAMQIGECLLCDLCFTDASDSIGSAPCSLGRTLSRLRAKRCGRDE